MSAKNAFLQKFRKSRVDGQIMPHFYEFHLAYQRLKMLGTP